MGCAASLNSKDLQRQQSQRGKNDPHVSFQYTNPHESTMKRLKKGIVKITSMTHASSLGLCVVRGGIQKGDIFVADAEELEILDTSEIHARRLNERRFPCQRMEKNSYSFSQMDQSRWQEEIKYSENQLNARGSCTRRGDVLQGESDGSQLADNKRATQKPEMISGVFLGIIFIVITFNRDLNSSCQKKCHSFKSVDIQARQCMARCLVEYVESSSTRRKRHWAIEKP